METLPSKLPFLPPLLPNRSAAVTELEILRAGGLPTRGWLRPLPLLGDPGERPRLAANEAERCSKFGDDCDAGIAGPRLPVARRPRFDHNSPPLPPGDSGVAAARRPAGITEGIAAANSRPTSTALITPTDDGRDRPRAPAIALTTSEADVLPLPPLPPPPPAPLLLLLLLLPAALGVLLVQPLLLAPKEPVVVPGGAESAPPGGTVPVAIVGGI